MARGPVLLPQGMSISEDVTLGVLVRGVPVSIIDQVLRETNRQSVRERALPARFMVYFVMAMTLFFQASYLEVQRKLFAALRWLSLVDRGRGRQERDHDGPPAARPGTAAAAVRAGRPADRWRADPRGVVPRAPSGRLGRHDGRSGRRAGDRGRVRPSGRRRRGGLSADAPVHPDRNRDAGRLRPGRRPAGDRRGGTGARAARPARARHAVPGRPRPGRRSALPRRPGPTCCGGCAPTRSSRAAGGCPTAPS
jgi:hypothetical protein